MALDKKQKEIKERKIKELDVILAEKQRVINSSKEIHTESIKKLQEELDEETLLRDALNLLK